LSTTSESTARSFTSEVWYVTDSSSLKWQEGRGDGGDLARKDRSMQDRRGRCSVTVTKTVVEVGISRVWKVKSSDTRSFDGEEKRVKQERQR